MQCLVLKIALQNDKAPFTYVKAYVNSSTGARHADRRQDSIPESVATLFGRSKSRTSFKKAACFEKQKSAD